VITFCFYHVYCNNISILTVIHKANKYCETILLYIWHLWLARASLRFNSNRGHLLFWIQEFQGSVLDWNTVVLAKALSISLVLPSSRCTIERFPLSSCLTYIWLKLSWRLFNHINPPTDVIKQEKTFKKPCNAGPMTSNVNCDDWQLDSAHCSLNTLC
jgi:hypothetical protein